METIRIEFPLKNSGAQVTEQDSVSYMMVGLKKLLGFGALQGKIDDFLLDYEFSKERNYCTAIIKSSAMKDASKFQSIGASLSYPVEIDKLDLDGDKNKTFSAATIQERLRIVSLPPKVKFRSIVMDYKKYWDTNKIKFSRKPEMAVRLKNMFVADLNQLFSEILPYVQEGKQLAALTGLQSVTEGMNMISRDLSLAYARAIKQTKSGQLSNITFKALQVKYADFMNQLIPQVFVGIEDVMGQERSFSAKEIDTVYMSGNLGMLVDMLDTINTKLGNGEKLTVKIGSDSWNLDPEHIQVESFSKSTHSKETSGYKTTSDGRIKLFT
jgi:hypothetical protein